MVHVVVVGGAGNVGREIVEELVTQGKHQVTVFSRKEVPDLTNAGINVVKVDYSDKAQLTQALHGVHTVLSFVSHDPENVAQKTLIAACVEAGVKRFAPSEWALRSKSGLPGYAFKDEIHEHLKQLNAEKTVLEYTLFQPGIFTNYLSYPHKTAKYLHISPLGVDAESGHAIVTEEGEEWQVWTTVQDCAKVVARAIDYEDQWPEVGGIVGSRIKTKDRISLVEKYAGRSLERHVVKVADLEQGKLVSSWIPPFSHPNMPPEMLEALTPVIMAQWSLVTFRGAADVPASWNKLLPDMQLMSVETFFKKVYGEKV